MAFNSAVKGYGSYQASSDATAEFNRLRHTISENNNKIQRNNTQIQKLVAQLGGPTDDMPLKDKLHKLQHQTNQLARQTTTHLQFLSSLSLSPIETKQNRPIIDRLTNEFSGFLRDFQSIQRSHVTEQKKSLSKEKSLKQHQQQQLVFTDEDELNSSQIFKATGSSQDQLTLSGVERDLGFIEEQEREIMKLETDISDINEVFKDLGVLIHNQAEVVDSIEANTESASENVGRGAEELRKARQYRDKIRKRKFILISIATVAGALLLVIIIISASK